MILAEDVVFVSPAGPVGKEQWIARAKQRPAPDANETRRFDDLRIRVYGEVAIVNGAVVRTDLTHGSAIKEAFTDVFVRHDGRWQAVNSQQTPRNSAAAK